MEPDEVVDSKFQVPSSWWRVGVVVPSCVRLWQGRRYNGVMPASAVRFCIHSPQLGICVSPASFAPRGQHGQGFAVVFRLGANCARGVCAWPQWLGQQLRVYARASACDECMRM
jgi:hypothetical protein